MEYNRSTSNGETNYNRRLGNTTPNEEPDNSYIDISKEKRHSTRGDIYQDLHRKRVGYDEIYHEESITDDINETGIYGPLYEMASYRSEETGLPFDIWVDTAGKNRKVGHNSQRIKIRNNGKEIVISYHSDPKIEAGEKNLKYLGVKEVNAVKEYLKKNKAIFLAHWGGEITDTEFGKAMNAIKDDPNKSPEKVLQRIMGTGDTREFGFKRMVNMYKAGEFRVNSKGELTYTYAEDGDMKGVTVVCVDSDGEPYMEEDFKHHK